MSKTPEEKKPEESDLQKLLVQLEKNQGQIWQLQKTNNKLKREIRKRRSLTNQRPTPTPTQGKKPHLRSLKSKRQRRQDMIFKVRFTVVLILLAAIGIILGFAITRLVTGS
jgi:uncharacterized membrane protein YccC